MCYNAFIADSSLGASPLLDTLNANLPPAAANNLAAVLALAHEANLSLYLVGGSVRDLLLGRGILDLDLVTEGDAPKLAATVAEKLGGQLTAHSHFGTATVETHGLRLDFSTARQETYPRPGALPQIAPSDMHSDLWRRDFSVNAMALCLAGTAEGSLIDLCDAHRALQQRCIRVLHSASFLDDPTRMFRAVRYEQRLGFTIEPDTLQLLQEALAQNAVSTLSADRLRHELELILQEESPLPPLHRAENLGLLNAIYPGLTISAASTPQTDATETTGQPVPEVVIARMAYTLQPAQAEGLAARLNMAGQWRRAVTDAADLRGVAETLESEVDPQPSRIARILERYSEHALTAAISQCRLPQARSLLIQYATKWRFDAPLLNGHDLKKLGVAPGPETGHILQELRRARLDGQVSSREEEIALVESLLEQRVMEGACGAV